MMGHVGSGFTDGSASGAGEHPRWVLAGSPCSGVGANPGGRPLSPPAGVARTKGPGSESGVVRVPAVDRAAGPNSSSTAGASGSRRTLGGRRPPTPTPRRIGYSAVPEADVRVEPGAEPWNGEPRETGEAWLFADSLIRHHQLRADPGDLCIIAVDGDSMEPLLSSGDHILIDVSRTVPAPPGIFVIWDGIALVAKRIEHVPHSAPRGPQTGQPRVRQPRAARRGGPRRRPRRLGLQKAVARRW